MPVVKMYDTNGSTVINPGGTILMGATPSDVSSWDAIILEMRVRAETYSGLFMLPPPVWTLGGNLTLDPGLRLGVAADGFYVSHITDLRAVINAIQVEIRDLGIDPGMVPTVWSTPTENIVPRWDEYDHENNNWTDARDCRFLDELLNAMDYITALVSEGLIPNAVSASAEFMSTGNRLGD